MILFRKEKPFWVSNFRAISSALKKSFGRCRAVRQNVARVKASIHQSPKRSAHAAALGLSGKRVRRVMYRDLHIYPPKMTVAQELSERDFETCRDMCEDILQNILSDAVFFILSNESTFCSVNTIRTRPHVVF